MVRILLDKPVDLSDIVSRGGSTGGPTMIAHLLESKAMSVKATIKRVETLSDKMEPDVRSAVETNTKEIDALLALISRCRLIKAISILLDVTQPMLVDYSTFSAADMMSVTGKTQRRSHPALNQGLPARVD